MTTATLTEKKPGRKPLFERVFVPTKITIEERKEGDDPSTKKRMRVEGLVSMSDEATGNGRRYGKKIWERHVGDRNSDFMQRIKENKVLGCLEHPEADASLDQVSHLVEDAWMTPDGGVHARFLIFNEGNGKILRELFECGVPVGSSSRGEGSTQVADDGVTEDVDEDYEIEAWDFVHTPALDSARARPVAESKVGRKERVVMNEALDRARKIVSMVESKNLSALGLQELTGLHMNIVESMTPLASSTDSDASEVRGRLAGLGSQVSKAIGENGKTKDDKVAEAVNAQYPDAMTGISALVEKLVKQNESLSKQLEDAKGADGSETAKKLEAAMKAGQNVVIRCTKLMKEKQTLEKKFAVALRTLDKVMEAVRAKGLTRQIETMCGKVPALRHVKSELLKVKTVQELEEKVAIFSKLIAENQKTTPPARRKTESRSSSRTKEPLPPTKAKKGRQVLESRAPQTADRGLFGRIADRGM